MLSSMKFDFQIDNKDDLEQFKTIFFRNIGMEKVVYDFHLNDTMVRVQAAGYGRCQNITISFFSITKEGKSTSTIQFNPTTDDRFRDSEAINGVWRMHPNTVTGSFSHREDGEEDAFAAITGILAAVYQVYNSENLPVI